MPSKNKSSNGFMSFALEWKAQYGRHLSISEATAKAGKIWATMGSDERAPYKERSKNTKNAKTNKLTCTGASVSVIENEKEELANKDRLMKREVESTVRESVKSNGLGTKSYYFIMVNYYIKTLKGGIYVPAELSVCEYSLKDGIIRMYHTFINPGVHMYGHQYEAKQHAESTHNLPLPPNALGEPNMGNIYNDVLNFIRDGGTHDYPPIYTHRDCMHIVESVFDFLKSDDEACNVHLKIYPIQYLFYIMKDATCEVGELEKPSSFYITDAYFEKDFFEYQCGIACQYHEDIDRSKYCTQSYVTRWCYMFSDYMCRDIAISLIPGRHCPLNTNLNALVTPAPSTCDDSSSFISLGTTSSRATKALAGSKIYYDDQKSAISDGKNKYDNNFPALGARKKVQNTSSSSQQYKFSPSGAVLDDDCKNLNPWSLRSRNVPREPDATDFNIDYTRSELEFDENSSVTSFGRGRGSFTNTTFSSASTYSGRGHTLRR